ncbi:MAG: phosphate transport system regulatory protein PhoU, partial [Rhodococcus sp. (in: high G+C Gram-positive bacteria)]
MRVVYNEQMGELGDLLGEMAGLAGTAMERSTRALLEADLALAEQVIDEHEKIT